ncbi:SUMF1/EgtB/PvdO family nonheme iron enzyme [Devosia sp. D6-9]|nr:SUMF1/EgtB/PvdO family nonheme iron enzyme [Devosia sp. D6-9]
MIETLVDFVSTAVGDALKAAIPEAAVKLIPESMRIAAIERGREWGPFKVISTNHDLMRAVRVSWIRAALIVFDAADVVARESPKHRLVAADITEFTHKARPLLRRIRLAAFNRSDDVGSTPIDGHVAAVLSGVVEYINPGSGQKDTTIDASAAAVLEAIVGSEVPDTVRQILVDGVGQTESQPVRSFAQLVFADFAEILKNPTRYPEAMPAFQIYLAGATNKLGDEIRKELIAVQAVSQDVLARINSLELLGAQSQAFWLERFERAEAMLTALETKLDDHTALLNAIAAQVGLVSDQQSAALWEVFRIAYTTKFRKQWLNSFPGGKLSDYGPSIEEQLANPKLFELDEPPLIDEHAFKLVHPDPIFTPLDILVDNKVWLGGESGGLEALAFPDIMDALNGDETATARLRVAGVSINGLRLAVVSSSGVGKTTTLRRIQHEINNSGAGLAVLLDFAVLRDAQGDTTANLMRVFPRLLDDLGILPIHQNQAMVVLENGLRREIESGRLTILVDGLDHIGATPRALTNLQDNEPWMAAHVVISGRPEAFSDWRLLRSAEFSDGPDLTRWCVVSPDDLTPEQSRAYLGGFVDPAAPNGKVWRYDMVSRGLGEMLKLPRVLAHIRILTRDQLSQADTAADIYNLAVMNLLREGVKGLPERAGQPASARETRLLGLLGALAFQSTFKGPGELHKDPERQIVLEDEIGDLRIRTRPIYEAYEGSLSEDLADLARLSAFVGNGLLEPGGSTPGTLRNVRWVNRTVRAFMTAYWLARWASRAPLGAAGIPETDWFRNAIYYPYSDGPAFTEQYRLDVEHIYQLNLFLSEMPHAHLHAGSWAGAASAWYDPSLVRGEGRPGLWSTEMLARSWRTMHAIAGIAVDDWWDISYDDMCRIPIDQRAANGPHRVEPIRASERQSAVATQAIKLFRTDFAQRIAALGDQLVRELAPDGWASVPAGEFRMGSPMPNQGFPPKTEAYWHETLRLVESCPREDLDGLASKVSPEWWWSGLQGIRQRREEIQWLVDDVFLPYRTARTDDPVAAKSAALDKLRDYFRRMDETPAQPLQAVGAFEMSVTPVTNRTFALFSPGFITAIRPEVEKLQAAAARSEPEIRNDRFIAGWAEPDRPVIYTTWFDAWAFCQWANWMQDGVHMGCRLPHEPEWEYACKRAPTALGGEATAFEQRYWWSDDFYADDHHFSVEHVSRAEAHSSGWPGATRSPENAAPNGFGLKDMIGNVWEWSANVYDGRTETEIMAAPEVIWGYSRTRPQKVAGGKRPPESERLPPLAASRTMRGGVWYYMSHIATAASRFRLPPNDSDYKIGFRLVREHYDSESSAVL